jgi:hypothetical protein
MCSKTRYEFSHPFLLPLSLLLISWHAYFWPACHVSLQRLSTEQQSLPTVRVLSFNYPLLQVRGLHLTRGPLFTSRGC